MHAQDGWTAIMHAACNGHVSCVRAMLSVGAETNLKNNDGKTALELAQMHKHDEVARVLSMCNEVARPGPSSVEAEIAALEAEIQREWMRTAEALQRQRKHIQLRDFAAKEPVSTGILLDSLRALPIKNVVLMLDKACNCKSVNVAAMEAAEKIILEERGDEITTERARQQHQLEVAEGLVPAPKRQSSEVGPFGETTDTHDVVYEVVKSGAGKGQTMPIRTWVLKSALHSVGEEDAYEGAYFDSGRGIDWGN